MEYIYMFLAFSLYVIVALTPLVLLYRFHYRKKSSVQPEPIQLEPEPPEDSYRIEEIDANAGKIMVHIQLEDSREIQICVYGYSSHTYPGKPVLVSAELKAREFLRNIANVNTFIDDPLAPERVWVGRAKTAYLGKTSDYWIKQCVLVKEGD